MTQWMSSQKRNKFIDKNELSLSLRTPTNLNISDQNRSSSKIEPDMVTMAKVIKHEGKEFNSTPKLNLEQKETTMKTESGWSMTPNQK